MTVHFIGAGPGAVDLLTLRAERLIRRCPVCLYAGALVDPGILALAPGRAIDTQGLDLEAIVAHLAEAHAAGEDVARLHSGDVSFYSAVGEQAERLDALGIPYALVPGVPAFAAAAAALGRPLTRPGLAQSVTLARWSQNATPVGEGEDLAALARTGATLCIHLARTAPERVAEALMPVLGPDCPAAIVSRASLTGETVREGRLMELDRLAEGLARPMLMLVGRALDPVGKGRLESHLYAAERDRMAR
ncbi:MAG: SAM-dependent methyltransferase [Pseudomonadota bacterium]